MKNLFIKVVFISILLFSFQELFSQVLVEKGIKNGGSEPNKEEDYERLQQSVVYFVVPDYLFEDVDKEEFTKQIKKCWTYSKHIEVVNEKESQNHLSDEMAAFFTIGYTVTDARFSDIYFELWQVRQNRVKMYGPKVKFGRIALYLPCEIYSKLIHAKKGEITEIVNGKLKYLNFNAGITSFYLKNFCNQLENRKGLEDPIRNEKIKELATDTLYIVETFLEEMKPSEGNCKKEVHNSNEIEHYAYPYKIISREELEEKLSSNRSFYFLDTYPNCRYYNVHYNTYTLLWGLWYGNFRFNYEKELKKWSKTIENALKKK